MKNKFLALVVCIFLISLQMAYAEGVSNTNTSNMGELV